LRLGNADPADGLWLVGSGQQALAHDWPVFKASRPLRQF
jgi:hypothetical protein